jgi:asparagine synthase (glutamine-hydrolysing)
VSRRSQTGSHQAPDPRQAFARVATLEASLYMRNQLLRDTDWVSMAHSLEVRVPLVDATLPVNLSWLARDVGQQNAKSLLAEAPRRPLPGHLIQRRKSIGKWIDWQQQSPVSDWKRVPVLRLPRCQWSRRWAYCLPRAV